MNFFKSTFLLNKILIYEFSFIPPITICTYLYPNTSLSFDENKNDDEKCKK